MWLTDTCQVKIMDSLHIIDEHLPDIFTKLRDGHSVNNRAES
jgi:hypothetical protein